MIHSMTGFARRESSEPWGTLSCEIRSVNHRYLEAVWKLPEDLRPVEPDFRRLAAETLKRGKVECGFRVNYDDDASRGVRLDETTLDGLLHALESVRGHMHQAAAINPLDVLRWPGVVAAETRDTEPVQAAAVALLEATLEDLVRARRVEGERLASMLLERCDGIETLIGRVRERLPEVRTRLRERLQERLADLEVNLDEDRLEQEVALLVQKMDVDEEVDRLESHVAEVRRLVTKTGPVGRRLDFLMQELNREANTLASKSQDRETTRAAVELKVLIEQMREQIQNIE
jgi:uncharacterized protein (TIGR00255 family)